DGSLDPWSPLSGIVKALLRSGDTLFVAGRFQVGGVVREFAAFSVSSGALLDWNVTATTTPGTGGMSFGDDVMGLAADGSPLFVTGIFSSIGGQPRNGVAALSRTTGAVLGWDPQMGPGYGTRLCAGNGVVYVAGIFDHMGGQARRSLAAVDPVTAS